MWLCACLWFVLLCLLARCWFGWGCLLQVVYCLLLLFYLLAVLLLCSLWVYLVLWLWRFVYFGWYFGFMAYLIAHFGVCVCCLFWLMLFAGCFIVVLSRFALLGFEAVTFYDCLWLLVRLHCCIGFFFYWLISYAGLCWVAVVLFFCLLDLASVNYLFVLTVVWFARFTFILGLLLFDWILVLCFVVVYLYWVFIGCYLFVGLDDCCIYYLSS